MLIDAGAVKFPVFGVRHSRRRRTLPTDRGMICQPETLARAVGIR